VIDSSKLGESLSRRRAGLAALLGLGLALGGCSTMSDIGEATSDGVSTAANAMNPFNWFGGKDGEETAAAANTATKTGANPAPRDDLAQRTAAQQDQDRYPKLSTVPERPKEAKSKRADLERKELREGLVADTANAQYTDKELRAVTAPSAAAQGMAQGQPDLARSNERVTAEPPAQPAPTMPVASSPAAPLQAPPTLREPSPPAAAPAAPRVTPPPAAPSQASAGASTRRQAAAASAAPVTPVAPPTAPPAASKSAPKPERQASLAQPAPEKPSAEQPESVLKTVQVATIYFSDGSARLSANDMEVVNKVAEVARRTGGTLRIIGHSSVGAPSRNAERKEAVNYKVSLDRAKAVAEALRQKGLPSEQVQVMAEGGHNPIYAETTRTGAAGNRRAEIYLDYRERL
jgi:outer membrane protein OmpA-like peptidoglycan-associated protein